MSELTEPPPATIIAGLQTQSSVANPPSSRLAATALLVGILSVFIWPLAPLGLILGALALVQINKSPIAMGGTSNATPGIIASAFGTLIFWGAVVGVPSGHERARSASCQNNLKQQGMALLAYAQDYDGQFPDRAAWEDADFHYTHARAVDHCPSAPDSASSYAWNGKLSRLTLRKAIRPAITISIFDAKGTWNQSGGLERIAPRHHNGLNIAFVDGHVKWLHPDQLDDFSWDPNGIVPAKGM